MRASSRPILPPTRHVGAVLVLLFLFALRSPAFAEQCLPDTMAQHSTGSTGTPCQCFIPGEEAGVAFTAPAGKYPIEVLRVGIGWASPFGGQPDQLEQGIHVYNGGLPDPGARLATIDGPTLVDGILNVFDFENHLVGPVEIASGVFSTTIEFVNQSSGTTFNPSVIWDANSCQADVNLVKTIPGGWSDACDQGVQGDWIFAVWYRESCQATGVRDLGFVASSAAFLAPPQPNPFQAGGRLQVVLGQDTDVMLAVYDLRGRRVATVTERYLPAGVHDLTWNGRGTDGNRLAAGVYLVRLQAGSLERSRKLVLKN